MSKREEQHEHSVEHIKNPKVWHDSTDVNVRAVLVTLAVMVLSAILINALIAALLKYFEHSYTAEEPQANPMRIGRTLPGPPDPIRNFPQPLLQPDPVGDRNKTAAQEELWLNSYGWVDKNGGVAHVPISDAIEMFLQQQSSATPPTTAGKPAATYHPQNLPSDYQEWK